MNCKATLLSLPILAIVGIGVTLVACSSSSSSPTNESLTSTAAAVSGAPDTHCGTKTVTVSQAACKAPPAEETEAGTDTDQADGGADTGDVEDYPPTEYNSEGDDDDCKYHVKWTSGTVAQNADVRFQIGLTTKVDGKALTGSPVTAEVFLNKEHPAPNSGQKTTETTPGTYVVGPIRFDAPGQWTIRFHIHEDCNDSEVSPHGHVAFFVQVP